VSAEHIPLLLSALLLLKEGERFAPVRTLCTCPAPFPSTFPTQVNPGETLRRAPLGRQHEASLAGSARAGIKPCCCGGDGLALRPQSPTAWCHLSCHIAMRKPHIQQPLTFFFFNYSSVRSLTWPRSPWTLCVEQESQTKMGEEGRTSAFLQQGGFAPASAMELRHKERYRFMRLLPARIRIRREINA